MTSGAPDPLLHEVTQALERIRGPENQVSVELRALAKKNGDIRAYSHLYGCAPEWLAQLVARVRAAEEPELRCNRHRDEILAWQPGAPAFVGRCNQCEAERPPLTKDQWTAYYGAMVKEPTKALHWSVFPDYDREMTKTLEELRGALAEVTRLRGIVERAKIPPELFEKSDLNILASIERALSGGAPSSGDQKETPQ